MIVRNEAAVIERCLGSVKSFLSHWTICDTGSTDGTPEIIERFFALAGIPGKLYRDEWVNFGHNRTLAMQRAKGTADYHLLLDADMVLRVESSKLSSYQVIKLEKRRGRMEVQGYQVRTPVKGQ
jgi:glycosyltransferase involved in cell wall biosynthesis